MVLPKIDAEKLEMSPDTVTPSFVTARVELVRPGGAGG